MPDKLKDFFKNYAYAEEKYKFTSLTLFCCASYDFGKELARIMPEIKITCFKEYIRIENGQAYPYALDARRKAVPIDENGGFIQALEYDAKDKLMNYFPAPLRVFGGLAERLLFPSLELLNNGDAKSTFRGDIARGEDPKRKWFDAT